MEKLRVGRWWLAVATVAVVIAGWFIVRGGHADSRHPITVPTPGASSAPGLTWAANADPAVFARQVLTYAGKSGVDPQLLMAILYNESYKPHAAAFERAWQRFAPDAAFGIANMHKGAFDETKRGRDFADRTWQELPDHPDLAIEAAAWYLHDLGTRLPRDRPSTYTRDELLALGYNAGPANMLAFVRGVLPGAAAQSYLDRLHVSWPTAEKALSNVK